MNTNRHETTSKPAESLRQALARRVPSPTRALAARRAGGDRRPPSDERGITELLGLMLAFGLVMSLVVLLQVSAVPVWNSQVEYDHNQRVTQDMAALDDAVSRAAVTGAVQSVDVETGVSYPSRYLFQNPPPAAGSLRTVPGGSVTVENAVVTDDSEAADYWTGVDDRVFSTRSLVYEPDYNDLEGGAGVVHEGTVVYRVFENGDAIVDRSALLSGNRITLVQFEGDIASSTTQSTSVTLTPLDPGVTSLPVTSPSGSNLEIVLTSDLTAAEWTDALADEPNFVSATDTASGDVRLTLRDGVTYDLRVIRIGIENEGTSNVPVYLVNVDGPRPVADADGRYRLIVEARDANNNPVANADVTYVRGLGAGQFESGDGAPVTDPTGADQNGEKAWIRTDDDGRATVWYMPPAVDATQSVNVYLGTRADPMPADVSDPARVQFRVKHVDFLTISYDVNGDGFPDSDASPIMTFRDASAVDPSLFRPQEEVRSNRVTYDIQNTLSSDTAITAVRLQYITQSDKTGGQSSTFKLVDGPTTMTGFKVVSSGQRWHDIEDVNGLILVSALEGSAPHKFTGNMPVLPAGQVSTLVMEFDSDYTFEDEEAILISVTIYYEGGIYATYSVNLISGA